MVGLNRLATVTLLWLYNTILHMLKRCFSYCMAFLLTIGVACGCTTFQFSNGSDYLVASNFDWADARIIPVYTAAGGERHAAATDFKGKLASWPIRYSSLTFDMAQPKHPAVANQTAVAAGMNNQGLQAAVLWLDATQYPAVATKPIVPSAMWVAYLLDQAKDVPQAIALSKTVTIEATNYNGTKSKLHIILNDAAGHTAILELLHGQLVVISGKKLARPLITNTTYTQCDAAYTKAKQDAILLPGYHSLARYERAAYLLDNNPPHSTNDAFAILNAVKEPASAQSPTRWEVVYNLNKKTITFSRDFTHYQVYKVN